MFRHGSIRSAAFLSLMLAALPVLAADWPNFRGQNHDGISSESGFKTHWTAKPPVVWEADVGSAFSSFAIVGDRLFTCGTADKQQMVMGMNAETGAVLWKFPVEAEYRERQGGDGTRATPAVSDNRVYVLGALGRLVCLNADDGKLIWEAKYDQPPQWGYSGSVLIEGQMAIACGGGPYGDLAAYDKSSGSLLWKTGQDPVGYATPYPFTFNNHRYIAGFTGTAALVVDAATGKEIWRMPWKTDWNVNAAAPIFHKDHLFFSSGYQHGAVLLKLTADGPGFKATEVWENKSVRNKFQSSILFEDHLYTSDEHSLKCVEFMTGKEKWSQRGIKDSTLLIADGQMIILSEGGELVIAPATPAAFSPTTRTQILDGRCWSVPVLANGRLYARDLEHIVCLNLK